MKVSDFYMERALPVILLMCLLGCFVALGILVFTQDLNWFEWTEVSAVVS